MRWSAEPPLDPPEPPECEGCDDLAVEVRRLEGALALADALVAEQMARLARYEAAAVRVRRIVRRHAARPRTAA